MRQVKVDEKKARALYASADPTWKGVLEDSFGKEFFSQSIIDRIQSYEDACAETGDEPVNVSELRDKGFTEDEIDYRKIKTITKAYNEGWVADYKDENQPKWIPWFKFSPSGVRFNASDCDGSGAGAGGAARLCFKDEATSDAAGKKFTELYAKFLN